MFDVSTEVLKTYIDAVDGDKLRTRKDLVRGRKMMEIHFQAVPARLAVSAGDGLLHRSSHVGRSLRKSSVLFRSRVAKALDVETSSNKSASLVSKKARKPA